MQIKYFLQDSQIKDDRLLSSFYQVPWDIAEPVNKTTNPRIWSFRQSIEYFLQYLLYGDPCSFVSIRILLFSWMKPAQDSHLDPYSDPEAGPGSGTLNFKNKYIKVKI